MEMAADQHCQRCAAESQLGSPAVLILRSERSGNPCRHGNHMAFETSIPLGSSAGFGFVDLWGTLRATISEALPNPNAYQDVVR